MRTLPLSCEVSLVALAMSSFSFSLSKLTIVISREYILRCFNICSQRQLVERHCSCCKSCLVLLIGHIVGHLRTVIFLISLAQTTKIRKDQEYSAIERTHFFVLFIIFNWLHYYTDALFLKRVACYSTQL